MEDPTPTPHEPHDTHRLEPYPGWHYPGEQPDRSDPRSTPLGWPAARPSTDDRPRRGIRTAVIGGVAALALASGAAVGVVYADHGQTATASASGTTATTGSTGGQAWTPPSGGFAPPPGSSGIDPSQQFGSSPGDNGQGTTDASKSAEVGLVEITSTLTSGTSAGTGMVLTSDGLVVTNHHVVEGATSIKVTVVSTGKSYTATYLGSNSTKDVALLRLAGASGLDTVSLSSSAPSTGDQVTAVGDANGDGGSLTAAAGNVVALRQAITVNGDDGVAHRLRNLIEIDADVVPGDSGGALLDSNGQVIGMTVAASAGTPVTRGYAIPVATVRAVVSAVQRGEEAGALKVGYDGFIGVELMRSSTTSEVAGVVSGTAAARAGISAGDVITTLDGRDVRRAAALRKAVAAHNPGDRVTLAWTTTSGSRRTATLVLGRAPIA